MGDDPLNEKFSNQSAQSERCKFTVVIGPHCISRGEGTRRVPFRGNSSVVAIPMVLQHAL